MMHAFIQAKNFTRSTKPRTVTLIVIHTAECGERPGAARNVAAYFAGANAPQASAHYCVDSLETVQCVRDADVAWHAGPVNGCSIGIEHAGRAGQTPAEWADDYSLATLARSAALVASLCYRYGIPVVRLTADDLAAGKRAGICGHVDVTKGLRYGTHWDPGPSFPWSMYLDMVRAEVEHIIAAEAPTLPELPAVEPGIQEDDGGASRRRMLYDVVADMARMRYRGE